jgi:hypothetical protein
MERRALLPLAATDSWEAGSTAGSGDVRTLRLRATGLVTNPNRLDPDETGLEQALNVVSDRPGVLRPRRGFGEAIEVASSRNMHKMFSYAGSVLLNWDDGSSTYKLSHSVGGAFTDISSTFQAPDSKHMRGAVVAGNLYLTSNKGILRVDDNWAPEFAGAPAGIGFDLENSTLTTDTAGPLETEKQVAYRYCLSFVDDQGRTVRGAPSGRAVLRNTSASDKKRPQVRVLLPKKNGTASTALTTDYTLTVYRSENSPGLTDPPPGDEAVIYEAKLTSSQITNGYADITDTTPDDLRGSALLENSYNDSIVQSNYPPPYATEVVSWKGCLVGLNLKTRYRLELQILAVGGSYGIQNTDEFTVSDGTVSFTVAGKTTPGASTDYKLENTGSAAVDIELTAQNLCAAINRHATNTIVYAHYAGVPEDPRTLGKIVIEHRVAHNVTSFGVAVGSGDKTECFEPKLTTSTSDTPSSLDEWPDGWFISKPAAPDAVPTLNLDTNIGRLGTGEIILCAAALEDSLIIFTNKSTWRVTGDPSTGAGDPGTFRFELLRSTLRCIASESVQVVGGQVFALTNQGVVAINSGGIRIVSQDIDNLILLYTAQDGDGYLASTESTAFAVGHDTARLYVLWLTSESLGGQVAYVYNLAADSWTQWDVAANCAVLNTDTDKIWIARDVGSDNATVHIQKSIGTHTDDSDTAISCTIEWLPVIEPHGAMKHFRDCSVLFESSSSQPTVALGFTGEVGGATSVSVPTTGLGVARAMVPRGSAREHRLAITATMTADNWQLAGLVLNYRVYGERLGE